MSPDGDSAVFTTWVEIFRRTFMRDIYSGLDTVGT